MQKRTRNALHLDDFAIHLFHRAVQRCDEAFAEAIGITNLTSRQFAILLSVSQSNSPSQSDLVGLTGIDRSTLADIVRRMTKRGLLHRRRKPRDARAYVIRLTEFGQQVLKTTQAKARQADAAILALLTADQRRELLEALKTVGNSR